MRATAFVVAAGLLGACSTVEEQQPSPTPAIAGITCVFPLQHADAQEIVDIITDLLDASRRAPTRYTGFCALMTPEYWACVPARVREAVPRLVADWRTGSIVIHLRLEDLQDLEHIVELVGRLDVEVVRPR